MWDWTVIGVLLDEKTNVVWRERCFQNTWLELDMEDNKSFVEIT
jgi:hypothetical protein